MQDIWNTFTVWSIEILALKGEERNPEQQSLKTLYNTMKCNASSSKGRNALKRNRLGRDEEDMREFFHRLPNIRMETGNGTRCYRHSTGTASRN